MFIGKCSENGPLGFGERGRVGALGGRGISDSTFVTCTLFSYNRKESDRMCEEVDIPKDERLTPTSDCEIRPFKLHI